jgi:hypothetical protein
MFISKECFCTLIKEKFESEGVEIPND